MIRLPTSALATIATTAPRKCVLAMLLSLSAAVLLSGQAQAQWWTAAPADYEDCADRVQHSTATRDAKEAALTSCESKFAGRRKPGGGYTLYDFMQNRSFDIAGPNPTAAEQRMIDEQYAGYLDDRRRRIIAAAFAEKQREVQQQATVEADFRAAAPAETVREAKPVVLPRPRPKTHAKGPDCASEPLACGWSRLSSGLKDIKDALFGSHPPAKTKRT